MQRTILSILALLIVACGAATRVEAEQITAVSGLVTQTIFSFDSATPTVISTPRTVTGLLPPVGGGSREQVVGMDFRPSDGQLYALTDSSGIYTINPETGAATRVTSVRRPSNFVLNPTVGVAFDPTTEEMRVTSFGQNLRVNVDTGEAVVDSDFRAVDTGFLVAGVRAIGYANNVAGTTAGGATLFGTDGNRLIRIDPANEGVATTIGALNVSGAQGGFLSLDISDASGVAYAGITTGSSTGPVSTSLFTLSLSKGTATLVGSIGNDNLIQALAVRPTTAPIPEPATMVLFVIGLTGVGAAVRRRRTASYQKET